MIEVQSVAIQQVRDTSDGLLAFAHVTLAPGIRIYRFRVFRAETESGEPAVLVKLPTHYATDACGECGSQNRSGARFCNYCSGPLPTADPNKKRSLTTVNFRDLDIQDAIFDAIHEAAYDRLIAESPAIITQAG